MITMQTNFPGGNGKMLSAEYTQHGQEIVFLAETKIKEPQPCWFYFRLEGLRGQNTRLYLANAAQCLDQLGPQGWGTNHPVYRLPNGQWIRVSQVQCVLDETCCYRVWFDVPVQASIMEIAFCYPYQVSQLQQTLVECKTLNHAVIGYSYLGRPMTRVWNQIGNLEKEGKGIYVIARQHASEVTGAWIMDGILRYLSSKEGQSLTKDQIWWMMPITDVDGVEDGCYGKDQIWGDFNRSWYVDFPNRVELHAIEHDIDLWSERCQPAFFLDLHAPAHEERGQYFTMQTDIPRMYERKIQRIAARYNECLMEAGLEASRYVYSPAGYNSSAKQGLMSWKYIRDVLGIPAVTLETTYQGPSAGGFYNIEDYQKMGGCIARAIAEMI